VAQTRNSALEQTKRLLEAQRQDAQADQDLWRALAVEARDIPVILPIDEIMELAVCENITPVPLTQPWVRGLTNVRGQLYTVIDLSVFLGGSETRLSRDARIIMLGDQALGACLLVHNVMGLKLLKEEERTNVPDAVNSSIRKYFKGGVQSEERQWAILDLTAMRNDERFLKPSRVRTRVRDFSVAEVATNEPEAVE
jgi:twitching motility protein PilI